MNDRMFRVKMVEHKETLTSLAEALGISPAALSNKINMKSEFKQTEIAFIRDRWELSTEELDTIFFARPLS